MRVSFIGFSRRRFTVIFVRAAGLSFHQSVIWHDDQLAAHVEIGIGARSRELGNVAG